MIFANYDGVTKSTTVVGDYSFVGSNSVLNAPVTIGSGAYVAAGSMITGDVGPGDLGVARGQQRNVRWLGAAQASRYEDRGRSAGGAGRGSIGRVGQRADR